MAKKVESETRFDALLMAIREPSKTMYAAGALQSGGAFAAWQAMINAALGE